MSEQQDAVIHILLLGGLGEIVLNMMVVALGMDAVIIDSGLMFPDDSMPGVDSMIEGNGLACVPPHMYAYAIGIFARNP